MTTSPAKRILGVIVVLIAAVSLVATVFGAVSIWGIRQPLTDGLVTGIALTSETLDTTSEALVVVMDSLQTADETVSVAAVQPE